MAAAIATPEVIDLISESSSEASNEESSKEPSRSPDSSCQQLQRKIEWADKIQLRHATLELCKQIPEAAKLLSSLLPSPPLPVRGRNHPQRSFISKGPRMQLARMTARKSAPATTSAEYTSESEDEYRKEKKRKRACKVCGGSCSLSDESDGVCKQMRMSRAK
jgi:hypothetical protein